MEQTLTLNLDYFFLFTTAVEAIMHLYFFCRLTGKQFKWRHCLVFISFTFCILYVLPITEAVGNLLFIVLLFSAGVISYKLSCGTALLNTLLVWEIMQLSYCIFNSGAGILSPILFPFHPFLAYLCFSVLNTILALGLASLCYYIICKHFNYNGQKKNPYLLIILIPFFMIFMLSEFFNHNVYGNTVILDMQGRMNRGTNHLQILIIQLFIMGSLFTVIYAYEKLMAGFELNTRLSMLEQETQYQKNYIEEIKSRYDGTVSFRHDVKNHLAVLLGLLENGKYRQAGSFIQEIQAISIDLSYPCNTNNPVLDILLKNKFSIAASSQIQISCSLQVPYPCNINDLDFCIVLANALDNAVNACKQVADGQERYINVTGGRQGDFLMIEVENSCVPAAASGFHRGTGLLNIQAVAEKYNGAVSTDYQDTSYRLNVLLIIPLHFIDIPLQNN